MADLPVQAQATLERLLRFNRSWPKLRAGESVRADVLLAVLKHVEPLARLVLTLPLGYLKGWYPGAGYLTGTPKVTEADLEVARRLIYELTSRLPTYGTNPVEPWLYHQVQERAHQLLLLATDLDVGAAFQKVGTSASSAWDQMVSFAVVPYSASAQVGGLAEKSEAALQRALRFTNSFPKPGPGQGVKASAALQVLKEFEPLARKIAALPVGTKKGGLRGSGVLGTAVRVMFPLFTLVEKIEGKAEPGMGYLSGGSVITAADRQAAFEMLYEIEKRLPTYGDRPLEPWLYAQLKERAHHLFAVATDVEVDDSLLDKLARAWESIIEAIVELPRTLQNVVVTPALDLLTPVLWGAGIVGGVMVLLNVTRR